jgi:uncharacterized UPF0146 family protein
MCISLIYRMAGYKHIERCIGSYIRERYQAPVEIGIGSNHEAACMVRDHGLPVRCTDVRAITPPAGVPFLRDDIFSPDIGFYAGADLLYAIRPAGEMVPPMIALAMTLCCDLLVYHLGFESYGDGGEIIDCGVLLHRYHRA